MSKRAIEAAKKAYPNNDTLFFAEDRHGEWHPVTENGREINGFITGYEQAEKDTLERAITWLIEHANKYIVNITERYPDAAFDVVVSGKCWVDLKKAMEDEK